MMQKTSRLIMSVCHRIGSLEISINDSLAWCGGFAGVLGGTFCGRVEVLAMDVGGPGGFRGVLGVS